MCAACAGQMPCVNVCLEYGADKIATNASGQTAEELARSAGYSDVADYIRSFDLEKLRQSRKSKESNLGFEPFWCDTCKTSFSAAEADSHKYSTVHLFNLGHKPVPPNYLIPETNKGFQMLLKKGWNIDSGLGPTGDGHKYPVKTVLKRDRKGLGVPGERGKVTHFEKNDTQAIAHMPLPERKMSARGYAKKDQKRKERQAKRWEIDLRRELN